MFWLDFKLFGNGHGLGSPYFDDVFYYLDGKFYTWFGGFGAQLQSIEWFTPNPGTRRRLMGHNFVVFNSTRKFLRVRVSWAIITSYQITAEDLRRLKHQLQSWGHGSQINLTKNL